MFATDATRRDAVVLSRRLHSDDGFIRFGYYCVLIEYFNEFLSLCVITEYRRTGKLTKNIIDSEISKSNLRLKTHVK